MTKNNKVTKRRKGQSASKEMLAGTVTAWAWKCDFGLCRWAEPDRERLRRNGKPSPEAKSVAVRMIEEKEYRRLKRMMTANSLLDSISISS